MPSLIENIHALQFEALKSTDYSDLERNVLRAFIKGASDHHTIFSFEHSGVKITIKCGNLHDPNANFLFVATKNGQSLSKNDEQSGKVEEEVMAAITKIRTDAAARLETTHERLQTLMTVDGLSEQIGTRSESSFQEFLASLLQLIKSRGNI